MPCTGMPSVVVSRPVIAPDAVHQRFTVMRSGAAHQRAIDIEEREGGKSHCEWR